MCLDIVRIFCFGIANGQISSIFDRVICQPHDSGEVLSFHFFYFFLCTIRDLFKLVLITFLDECWYLYKHFCSKFCI